MINNEKFDIVVQAIVDTRKKSSEPTISVKATEQNGLNSLTRDEILYALKVLEVNMQVIWDATPLEYDNEANHYPIPFFDNKEDDSEEKNFTIRISENNTLSRRLFNDWHRAYYEKRKLKFKDLSDENIRLLYTLVEAIHSKLQMNNQPKLDIPNLYPTIEEYLQLLIVKSILNLYRFNEYHEPRDITVDINIDNFKTFYPEIKKIYTKRFPEKSDQGAHQANTRSDILYKITFTPETGEIIINDIVILSKLRFDGENEKVFEYLLKHPNKRITKKELERKIGVDIHKDFHKIADNLGFKRDLRKIFFNIKKDKILLRDCITESDLVKLGIERLRFQATPAKKIKSQ